MTPQGALTAWTEASAHRTRPGDEMTVACVIDDLGTGGAQRIVTLMGRELPGVGVRLVVISLGARGDEIEALRAAGVEVHVATGKRLTSPGRIRRLFRLLRALKPDLVHTHLLAAHVLGGLVARLLGIPVVSTVHNIDPHPRFAGTWKRVLESACLRWLAGRVIAVGPNVASSNAARLGGRHIDVLANPLSVHPAQTPADDSDRAAHRSEARARLDELVGSTASTRLLLTVGRLAPEKGWPELLDIVEALRETHPDCKLLAVGDGPCKDMLAREIATRDLSAHVHLLGRREDVGTYYVACDLFVLNSTIEGLPMALLEAMANGLPVVSTRVGDVEHAAAGVASLVEPGRPDAMLEAIRLTLDDPDQAQERAAAAQGRVIERFNAKRWSGELISLFASTIGGRG